MIAAVDIAKIPIEVAEHHQVQVAVVVQVHPGGAGRPAAAGDARTLGDISERTVAVVVIELVAAISRDVEVLEPIIVVIANRNSHAVTGALQTGFLRYVLE